MVQAAPVPGRAATFLNKLFIEFSFAFSSARVNFRQTEVSPQKYLGDHGKVG